MFDKLDNEKKPSNIMRQILKAIEDGKLREADKLPREQDLAKEFGVSRSVIREAMSSLVTMGVVKRIPGTGTFVQGVEGAPYSGEQSLRESSVFWDHLEEIEKVDGSYDAYLARLLIEPIIAEYTARRIEHKDLKKLKSIYDAMAEAVENKDMKKYQKEDLSFHLELAKSSGNEVLFGIFSEIMNLIGFNLWNAYRIWPKDGNSSMRSLKDHKVILGLIEEEKPTLVKDKMSEHLRAAFWEHKELE